MCMSEVRCLYLFVMFDRNGIPQYSQVVKDLAPSEVPGAVRMYVNSHCFHKTNVTVQVYCHSGEFFVFARSYSFVASGNSFRCGLIEV